MKTIEFRKEDHSKADQFLLNHWDSVIVPFGLEHADKLGHVEVYVKEDWTLESMRFIKGPFESFNTVYKHYQQTEHFDATLLSC